jgi:hypothetical protein
MANAIQEIQMPQSATLNLPIYCWRTGRPLTLVYERPEQTAEPVRKGKGEHYTCPHCRSQHDSGLPGHVQAVLAGHVLKVSAVLAPALPASPATHLTDYHPTA